MTSQLSVSFSEAPRRILLIRPSALGDVCRTVPVIVSLRRQFPQSSIDWLVQDDFAPAITSHPSLTSAFLFPRRAVAVRSWAQVRARRILRELLRQLHDRQYDLVLDCQGLGRSGFFAWCTRAPTRVGYANAAEFGWLGLNVRVPVRRDIHTVDRMLELVKALGIEPVYDLRLYSDPVERDRLDARVRECRYAVIAPTSRWEGKRWPAERFGELCQALLKDGRLDKAVLVGGASERSQCESLIELARIEPRVVDLIGSTTVGGLLALIEQSAIVIANDSAALHIAVGFNRPLLGLYGPTRIDLVGPYGRPHDVIQPEPPPAHSTHKDEASGRAAMSRIETRIVIQAALERLAHVPESTSSRRSASERAGIR